MTAYVLNEQIHTTDPDLPDFPREAVAYKELLAFEQKERKFLPKLVGNELVDIDVKQLLDGVDQHRSGGIRLFYSYSHKDETYRQELEAHLKLLQRQGLVETWHDRMIEAGTEWEHQIDKNLELADIILLLVSSDFIASNYCYDVEMRRAMDRHESGQARVVPVIVRDVDWRGSPFHGLQALPTDGKAVTAFPNRDAAWKQVSEAIRKMISTSKPVRRVPVTLV